MKFTVQKSLKVGCYSHSPEELHLRPFNVYFSGLNQPALHNCNKPLRQTDLGREKSYRGLSFKCFVTKLFKVRV